MKIPTFLLLVNEGCNGMPTGHIEGAEFQGERGHSLELTAARYPTSFCPKFSLLKRPSATEEGAVRISRRVFPIRGYRDWVGNWCWDAIAVKVSVAIELLDYLKELGWQCEGGDVHLCELFEGTDKFRPSDIAAACMTKEEFAERKCRRGAVGTDNLPLSSSETPTSECAPTHRESQKSSS